MVAPKVKKRRKQLISVARHTLVILSLLFLLDAIRIFSFDTFFAFELITVVISACLLIALLAAFVRSVWLSRTYWVYIWLAIWALMLAMCPIWLQLLRAIPQQ